MQTNRAHSHAPGEMWSVEWKMKHESAERVCVVCASCVQHLSRYWNERNDSQANIVSMCSIVGLGVFFLTHRTWHHRLMDFIKENRTVCVELQEKSRTGLLTQARFVSDRLSIMSFKAGEDTLYSTYGTHRSHTHSLFVLASTVQVGEKKGLQSS